MNQVTGALIKSLAVRLATTTDHLHTNSGSQSLKAYYSVLQLLDESSGGNIPIKLAYEKFQNILGLEKLIVKKVLTKLSLINLLELLPGTDNPENIKLAKVDNIASRLKMLSDELGSDYFSENTSQKRSSSYIKWEHELGKTIYHVAVRHELIDMHSKPIMPSLGFKRAFNFNQKEILSDFNISKSLSENLMLS